MWASVLKLRHMDSRFLWKLCQGGDAAWCPKLFKLFNSCAGLAAVSRLMPLRWFAAIGALEITFFILSGLLYSSRGCCIYVLSLTILKTISCLYFAHNCPYSRCEFLVEFVPWAFFYY
jgi:hypothetical protein